MRIAIEHHLEARFMREELDRCVADGGLDQYLAGDRSAPLMARIRQHAASCRNCREIIGDDVVISRPNRVRHSPAIWALAATAVIATGLGLWFGRGEDAFRMKGGELPPKPVSAHDDVLHVAVTRDGLSFRVNEGDALQDGDRLTFFHASTEPGIVSLWNVDDAGVATALGPPEVVAPGTDLPLAMGALVSSGQGCEWVVGVFWDMSGAGPTMTAETLNARVEGRSPCELVVDAPHARSVEIMVFRRK